MKPRNTRRRKSPSVSSTSVLNRSAKKLVDLIVRDLKKLPQAEQEQRVDAISEVIGSVLDSKTTTHLFQWTPENGAKWASDIPTSVPLEEAKLTVSVQGAPDLEKFSSGAVRSSDAKNEAWELISPIGLRRLAETYQEGKIKYGAYNMEKGMPVADLLRHTIRHVFFYLNGDRSEDHLAHAAWGLLTSMHMEETLPTMLEGLRPANGQSIGGVK